MRPVVLSGGAGTRLWPLSTRERPKQFLDLLGEPLLVTTLSRLRGLSGLGPALVVTGRAHLSLVEEVVTGSVPPVEAILIEPTGRNTAPAVVAAALVLQPDETMVVLPSDHHIADVPGFVAALEGALDIAEEGHLVTFGIPPTRPETGYGYIQLGPPLGAGYRVERFKEKPGPEEASAMIGDGRHLWNSGMFVFRVDRFLAEADRHAPEVVAGVRASLPPHRGMRVELGEHFTGVPSVSVDHAVMERTDRAAVVPLDVGWSDIGSWQSLWEVSRRDDQGNVIIGDVIAHRVTNSFLHAGSGRLAVAGVDRMVVVHTPQAVLVVPLDGSEMVRELAERAEGKSSED